MSIVVAERATKVKKNIVKHSPILQVTISEPLTENGMTFAEEMRILKILGNIKSGRSRTYSDEEAARYLGLEG